ncbi:MAG TPA: PilZ domain-containing protein, partial [Terriglobales bacterium]|nr:PilZ domain-containing protein [Terriglobales bacterium]
MTGRIERRTQSRKRPVSLVYVELPPANGGMMRDLSEHGFSLRAMNPLQMSEKVPFSFNLDSTARIDGEAIVIRLQDSGRVAALEFAGLSAHARDQIRRFLEKFDGAVAKESGPAPVPVQDNSTFDELRTEIRETEARPATPRLQLPIPRPELPPPAPAPAPPESLPSEPPPLLKLSSVRPETVKPVPAKWIEPEEEPEPVEVPALPIPEELATPPLQVLSAPRVQIPLAATPSEPLPELPPALEPLYSLEMESDEAAPSWMDRFTLTRAIVIMLVLTLLAGSFVYHRQLGHALVWLGQKIAGDQDSGSVRPAGIPEPKNTETVPASVDDLANSAAVTQTNSSTSPDALA